MKQSLENYLKKCRRVFDDHRQNLSKIIPFPTSSEPNKPFRDHLSGATADAEKSAEFEDFADALEKGPLSVDLKRLRREEEQERERAQKQARKEGRAIKSKDIDKWCRDTVRQAARSFFRNTGTYYRLWTGVAVRLTDLVGILDAYDQDHDSKYLRLFVFDGFALYDGKKRLDRIELPEGELRKFEEKELEEILRLPQTAYHGIVSSDIPKRAALWHILVVSTDSEYRGLTGIWLNGELISPFDLSMIGGASRRDNDIEIIGPLFICIGEAANLAVEIRIKTNVFESMPGYERTRNGYLPWDSYDDDGDPQPRRYVEDIGEGGKKLVRTYQLWHRLSQLAGGGRLRFATETYVRSLMKLHDLSDNAMDIFVGFVTTIESLLTPDAPQELAYKIAVRGASLLSAKPNKRLKLVELLTECYKIRSKIVHEGHAGTNDPVKLRNAISYRLSEMARQIFLRYGA
ncbi:MAG: hypothetical protein AB1512_11880 [Thermodesulfobacteriota bacterium]